jgi:hypothetical protein
MIAVIPIRYHARNRNVRVRVSQMRRSSIGGS